ncbi:MAG: ATP-binding protein [Gemmataceae bacterium]
MVSGARQTGKTTLFLQAIEDLVTKEGYPPAAILYATFDHPALRQAGLARTLEAWREACPVLPGTKGILFLDEIQNVPDWQVWLKHQVDFRRGLRVAVTGSATPLGAGVAESGVGRWETLRLPTLSFGEYLRLRHGSTPDIGGIGDLADLFDRDRAAFAALAARSAELPARFHEYLTRGGFPEPACAPELSRCQRLLREDLLDKVLHRDMTTLYGVRRVPDLERFFLYLCEQEGGILDTTAVSRHLECVTRQGVANWVDLLEATHLVHRLRPHGYGKEVLRGREKVYLADPAIAGAVLMTGRHLLERPVRLAAAVECAVVKHALTRYRRERAKVSYWRDRSADGLEVDLIVDRGEGPLPIEVKYQETPIHAGKLAGLSRFLEKTGGRRGIVITRMRDDLGVTRVERGPGKGQGSGTGVVEVLKVPAALACLILSGG